MTMAGTSSAASTHSGGSRRRTRERMTSAAGRARDRAISDPARANITPMDGKTSVSHAQPKQW